METRSLVARPADLGLTDMKNNAISQEVTSGCYRREGRLSTSYPYIEPANARSWTDEAGRKGAR